MLPWVLTRDVADNGDVAIEKVVAFLVVVVVVWLVLEWAKGQQDG